MVIRLVDVYKETIRCRKGVREIIYAEFKKHIYWLYQHNGYTWKVLKINKNKNSE